MGRGIYTTSVHAPHQLFLIRLHHNGMPLKSIMSARGECNTQTACLTPDHIAAGNHVQCAEPHDLAPGIEQRCS